jgi:predicted metal-dependent peptidase
MARTYELTEAIATLIHKHPFFAVLLLDLLEIVETESLPTAATDGKALMVNPEYFKKKLRTVDERVFVLAHEILHVIMHHPTRLKYYMDLGVGPDLKTFSKGKANHAMDYVINDTLIHDNVGKCPIGALVNPQFDRTMIWDEVYEQLPDEDDNDDSMDEHVPGDPGNAPSKAQIQRAVQSAAAAAKAQGKMPGSMQRLVDEICNPQVPWQEHLRKAVATLSGRDTQTWARPNRRRLAVAPHVYWPGRMGMHAGCVLSINDTSGSVSDKEQSAFFGELHGILSDLQPEMLYVMFVDAEVHGIHELHDTNDLLHLKSQVKGGGGTDMTVGFKEIDSLAVRPSTVIVFTDGYTPFGSDTGIPTIWCITSDVKAPWGTTVHVKVNHQ